MGTCQDAPLKNKMYCITDVDNTCTMFVFLRMWLIFMCIEAWFVWWLFRPIDSIIDSFVLFLMSSIYFFYLFLHSTSVFIYHFHFVTLSCIFRLLRGTSWWATRPLACRCLRVETQWLFSSDIAYLCVLYRGLICVVVIPPCW